MFQGRLWKRHVDYLKIEESLSKRQVNLRMTGLKWTIGEVSRLVQLVQQYISA